MILEPQQDGGLDYLGQMWTWVSGEAESVVDPTTLHGWLEATVGGRLHASVPQGQLHASVTGRLHALAKEDDL
jgi:hypothetical protein